MTQKALLVNLRTHHSQAGDTIVAPASSLIGMDFWGQPTETVKEQGLDIIFTFANAELNMPAGRYTVADSLIESVTVQQIAENEIEIAIKRYFAGPWTLDKDSMPLYRYNITFDPQPLQLYFNDKIILLDPWERQDVKSPTGLKEGTVTTDISRRLCRLLVGVGAKPHYVRAHSNYPTLTPGLVRRGHKCDLVLVITVGTSPDPYRSGFSVGHKPDSKNSLLLANILADEFITKTPLPLLSKQNISNHLLAAISAPGVVVEIGCITHRVDEGLMRDIDHRQKNAQGLFNALRGFFLTTTSLVNDYKGFRQPV